MNAAWTPNCPIVVASDSTPIVLAHGEGARLSRQLITRVIQPRLAGTSSVAFSDAALLNAGHERLAFCTDSHTVSPLFFPGGDIGSLSVYGTVNDLAVSGAKPRWLSLALIIEEGLPLAVLEKVLDSIAHAAARCDVTIVTGDTKVVPRGAVDSLMINTSGIGEQMDPVPPGPAALQPGDQIVVSGPIGCHGIAVMSARDAGIPGHQVMSDLRPLTAAVNAVRSIAGDSLRCVRDATRGGVSAVLHEWTMENRVTCVLRESAIPVTDAVRGACELLGLDPLYVANEGTFVAAIAPAQSTAAVEALRGIPGFEQAAVIGEVEPAGICPVTIRRTFATPRPLDEPAGAPLPRIC